MRDMVLSLAVILLAAGVIYLFIPHDEDQDPVKPVGYHVELKSARRAAPYPVAAPQGLPKQWRATSVRYEPEGSKGASWHLGFMTPDNQYAAVEQSNSARPHAYVRDVTQHAHRTGRTERIGGERWTRYEGRKYDALVRVDSGSGQGGHRKPAAGGTGGTSAGTGEAAQSTDGTHTTVVTGTASAKQLRQLAEALHTGGGHQPGAGTASPSAKSGATHGG